MSQNTKNCCFFKCMPICFCTPTQAKTLLREGKGRTLGLLLRHGATDWNMAARLQGRRDIPLNETGIEQAQTAAAVIASALKEMGDVGVYTSPLSRAKETAAYISEEINHTAPTEIQGLIERDYGSLEGLTFTQRQERFSSGAKHPDDMEPSEDAALRIMRTIGKIRKFSGDGVAVVVTHGGVLNLLFSRITRGRVGAGGNITANCTVSLVAAGERDIIPLAYNLSGEAMTEYIEKLRENMR